MVRLCFHNTRAAPAQLSREASGARGGSCIGLVIDHDVPHTPAPLEPFNAMMHGSRSSDVGLLAPGQSLDTLNSGVSVVDMEPNRAGSETSIVLTLQSPRQLGSRA